MALSRYNTVDFDPGSGTFNLSSSGAGDAFVSKLDSAGHLVWAKQLGGTSGDEAYNVAVDASGNVYAVGVFSGTADFDPGPETFNLTWAGGNDAFVVKLDSTGKFVWARRTGAANWEYVGALAVDGNGDVYIVGSFQETADFDPGPGTFNLTASGDIDVFVWKLNSAGDLVWAKQLGGALQDYAYDLAVDSSGNIYTVGYFQGTTDFDPGPGTFNLTSAGYWDVFISKLDSGGNFVWAKGMGGPSEDVALGVAMNPSGDAYTVGIFSGTADFDPGPDTFDLTEAGSTDAFVLKLSDCVACPAGCMPIPAGMVGWWRGEGNASDDVGANNGNLFDGAGFGSGLIGRAFEFDGVDDYVDIPQAPAIFFSNSEPFTVELWFKPLSETPSFFILKNAAYGIRWQGSANALAFYNGSYHDSARTSWTLGQWYHVALVDDGSTSVKLYIDGVLDKSDDGPARSPSRSPCHPTDGYCFALQFGGVYETHDVEYFKGQVDEVTLYSRALSASEIHGIFLAGANGKCDVEDADSDGYSPPDDCDDQDPSTHPGALEVCDAQDNDCDGNADGFVTTCGVGACGSSGLCLNGTDSCLARQPSPEVCDGLDNDCDGQVDNGVVPRCALSSIVAWWPGDDDARDLIDSNHGTPSGGASFASGVVGQAFSFDGVDAYVDIPDTAGIFFANDQAFTVEAWFMPISDAPSYFILKNAAYGIRWQGRGQPLLFFNGNNHYSSRTSWELGHWYHVAVVDDGSTSVQLYVDGVLDRSEDGPARNPNRFSCRPGFGYCFSLQFGAWYEPLACSGNCIEFFLGLVDEVTLYNRALTAAEIQTVFAAGSQGKCLVLDEDGDGYLPPDDCDDLNPAIHPRTSEVCDGLDNDCNGALDDGLQPQPTNCGVGACAATGQTTCVNGITGDTCTPGTPTAEVCNGIDDDCDGSIDEGVGVTTVSVNLDSVRLWPANHRMIDVHATVLVNGGCTGSCPTPVVVLASITGDEPDDADGVGDGKTVEDIQNAEVGSADFDFKLRAERDAAGEGRLYEVTYAVTDCSGDTVVGHAGVLVPHDEGGHSEPVIMDVVGQGSGGQVGFLLSWDSVRGASSYNILRGRLSLVRSVGSFTVLEGAQCLEHGITTTTFSGLSLEEVPPPGEAFFYLVEYFDGRYSGYGTATGIGEVVITSGDSCH